LLFGTRMRANSPRSQDGPRHFDRGRRWLIRFPAALLLAACSGGLGGPDNPGTAGSSGTSERGGRGGRGGSAGTAFGGTGGIGGTGVIGGTGGIGGIAGAGGMRPTCPAGTATFSVCVVNDADTLPLTGGVDAGERHDLVTAAPATVEAIGTGAAPAQCQNARVFGAGASSDWWVQVRTGDSKLWTIGVGGLGNTALVKVGDTVTLDLVYQYTPSGFGQMAPAISGNVQLSNAAGTPLLWAGSNSYSGGTWLSLKSGQALCDQVTGICPTTRFDVMATINGSVATLPPFSATDLGGYHLEVGEYAVVLKIIHTECAFTGPPAFAAAAVKTP